MHEWSATQNNLLFISGHTHKPVFASLDHIDRLAKQLEHAKAENNAELIQSITAEMERRKLEYAGKQIVKTKVNPLISTPDAVVIQMVTSQGIEIADGFIRLVKWKTGKDKSSRVVLEESPLFYLFDLISSE
jgi:hypothetical protein